MRRKERFKHPSRKQLFQRKRFQAKGCVSMMFGMTNFLLHRESITKKESARLRKVEYLLASILDVWDISEDSLKKEDLGEIMDKG